MIEHIHQLSHPHLRICCTIYQRLGAKRFRLEVLAVLRVETTAFGIASHHGSASLSGCVSANNSHDQVIRASAARSVIAVS